MDTLINNGDFAVSNTGIPVSISGYSELLQRAIICLSVKRGSFLHDKTLGSKLSEIKTSTVEAKDELALAMAQQALKNQPQIRACSAQVQYTSGVPSSVKILLVIENSREEVIINL